ncbi:NAD(P)H-dependent oxidoreductase [Streptomyces beihaiensis]|uniref:NAD(P)H-dependent oxidoreductase n=1 Tax=Streptomyces beihaiensis TaxID=2984495 RepID=A0ABT3TSY9_9ACTN|nr:NAD(P)H-dependent oxidoreductase [Streptomyces beihaiensis]MCX3060158.1 NAD(P)H-dependent oxidoreductase [Streptomyces beihaiensis]
MPAAQSTLVLLAHPHLDSSRINAALAGAARDCPTALVHDLYAACPDGHIDVEREQRLLEEHNTIVLQFPFYWYSVPPLLKQWMDEVLLEGYAYGHGGDALHGKTLQVVTTTGGPAASYRPAGYNRFSAVDLLLPLDATAHLIGMDYPDPLIFHGVRTWSDGDVRAAAARYRAFLDAPVREAAA